MRLFLKKAGKLLTLCTKDKKRKKYISGILYTITIRNKLHIKYTRFILYCILTFFPKKNVEANSFNLFQQHSQTGNNQSTYFS